MKGGVQHLEDDDLVGARDRAQAVRDPHPPLQSCNQRNISSNQRSVSSNQRNLSSHQRNLFSVITEIFSSSDTWRTTILSARATVLRRCAITSVVRSCGLRIAVWSVEVWD